MAALPAPLVDHPDTDTRPLADRHASSVRP
ncbi:hypothetical protein J2752_001985 [Halarchaeum rubridurum]|uniref:Uncharacterized protein n=1 Tax=Halarchaeum rubridurum TaxID=489911 RepID=A0A8T4GS71_9EURY|nr:hypothetical protein [Halarchaeum rubridurum]